VDPAATPVKTAIKVGVNSCCHGLTVAELVLSGPCPGVTGRGRHQAEDLAQPARLLARVLETLLRQAKIADTNSLRGGSDGQFPI